MIYLGREIAFKEIIQVEDWQIKVYTISKEPNFKFSDFYPAVKERLPQWLTMENSFDASNGKIGFLIVHEGTEGIFSIINWWVGRNMLNTHIFITPYDQLGVFKKISGDGLSPCIWEMEVINHERKAWVKYVLEQQDLPDFKEYLQNQLCGIK